ncbi:hypothetical protein N8I77_010791 [Diaporthe amygdali]|uniref:Protein kinase domain-containing protein n=1 Tax=Phomopsis amygdali TaxID=1214568 RepID=A0AAD9S982_PHOAM|nr:hypothetical protein N8I77_010791 [Diaporthe amygdali]
MSPIFSSNPAVFARDGGANSGNAIPDDPPDSSSWLTPGAGLTPEESDQAPALRIFIVTVGVLAVYNAAEIACMALLTFKHYRGLYFYSVIISGLAIIPYTIGFALDLLDVATGRARWAAVTLITIGWWPMITGQSVVLWSRLHLIVPKGPRGERIVRWTGWMIVVDAVIFHLPTTVFTYGSSVAGPSAGVFAHGYDVMEKIQMSGFFCQEVVLSSIYVVETFRILRTSLQPDTRTTMRQLLAINAVIIAMDLGLLGLEAASFYILETMLKGVVYSIKLKLEFAILGKLVSFVGGGQRAVGGDYQGGGEYDPRKYSVGFVSTTTAPNCRKRRDRREEDDEVMLGNMDHISEFVDLDRVAGDVTRPSRSTDSGPRSRGGVSGLDDDEHDFARFEYVEDVTTLRDSLVGGKLELNLSVPSMTTLFHPEQILIGQVGRYKIITQLQNAIWLARNESHKDVIIKSVQDHPRVANERDVLKLFTPRSKFIRPLLDEIVDPAEPTAIVLSHLRSTLLQASVQQKLTRTELKYACRGVLEALVVMHSEGYVHADVKADNVLVNLDERPHQSNRFTDVQLADMGNSYPQTHEYALRGEPIGAPMWSSPEVLMQMSWDTKTDIWSFGTLLISLIYGGDFNIFDSKDTPIDPIDDYKFAVLRRQVEIFGPFPVKYQEIANKDVMELVFWMLENLKESRTPFQNITDSEISPKDKEFISWIMRLDPRDRPPAPAILTHEWWLEE